MLLWEEGWTGKVGERRERRKIGRGRRCKEGQRERGRRGEVEGLQRKIKDVRVDEGGEK